MKNNLKTIKYLLLKILDAENLRNEWNTHELKCQHYELQEAIMRLAYMEQQLYLSEIIKNIKEFLPKTGGNNFFYRKLRKIKWNTRREIFDWIDYQLDFTYYDTDCHEFECLINCFNEAGLEYKEIKKKQNWTDEEKSYMKESPRFNSFPCGYSNSYGLYISFMWL